MVKRVVFLITLFVCHSSAGSIVLTVYVNKIVISGDDSYGIAALKEYLSTYFHMKDLDNLRYFLEIEVASSLRLNGSTSIISLPNRVC